MLTPLMNPTLLLPPFEAAQALVANSRCTQILSSTFPRFLPPRAIQQPVNIPALLDAELSTPVIDELYDWLWLVAAKSAERVDPLHVQHIKKRNINVAEDPALHLTWFYGDVYLKPVPLYLFNFEFWLKNLLPRSTEAVHEQRSVAVAELSPHCRMALGFLRSYAYLVRHESDFRIAQREHLVPDDISYEAFQSFISPFRTLSDAVVAKRYHYGQFRQTRLNYAVRFLRPKSRGRGLGSNLYYKERYWQSGQLLQDWAPSLLLVFALLSLILSSMQVVLQALDPQAWEAFKSTSRAFSLAVTFLCGIIVIGIPTFIVVVLLRQLVFAVRKRIKKSSHVP